MSFFRLKHLFGGLMGLSTVTAFIIPQRLVQGRVPVVDVLFAPVSRPSGAIARWAHNSFAAPDLSPDQRAAEVVKRENEELKNENSNLTARLQAALEIEGIRSQVGAIRQYCTPYSVTGSDSGTHLSLGVQGSSLQGLREKMVVLCPSGIVGRVERAGIAGVRVQLITDTGFHANVGFVRFDGAKYVRLAPEMTYVDGLGKGALHCDGLSREAAAGLQVGDWVTLNDAEWPNYMRGRALGRIVSITPRRAAPLFAEIIVEPAQNLLRLTEVLIVTKSPDGNKIGE